MSLTRFSVKNGILINMIMIIVFLFGGYTLIEIPKEEMPPVDFGAFYIIVSYRGVSPSEMEKLVVKKIEDEIQDLDNVDYINSTSQESRASIYIQMEPRADIDKAWNDLNTELEKVKDLPADADDPVVVQIKMRELNSICTISIGGDFSDNAIREIADDFKDEILDLDNISKVEVSGTRDRQIWVEADIDKLNAYNLSLQELINPIAAQNTNAPGGTVNFGNAELLIRTVGEFSRTTEIENVVLKMDSNGRAIYVNDVAVVKDTLEEKNVIGRLDGKPAVNIEVYKKAEGNIIEVMKNVRAKADEFKNRIDNLDVAVRNDGSIDVKNSLSTLSSNAMLGIVLVFITLWIFIGWKNALFAAWGIPFSFFLTFILMNQMDITLNNLSLFGLILVLGMIVDDAIIVLENIHRYTEMGYSAKEAAIKGTEEIMWPVISAVLTTVVAFLPMLLMGGTMGKFLSVFPVVVTLALAASLFESLVILPSHVADLSHFKKHKKSEKEKGKLSHLLEKHYRSAIRFALGKRWFPMIVLFSLLGLAGYLFAMGFVRFEFFPKGTVKTIVLKVETPTGTTLEETSNLISKIENHIFTMKERKDIESIVSSIGRVRERRETVEETSKGEIRIDLLDADKLTIGSQGVKKAIRSYVKNLPGIYSYRFTERMRGGPPTGDDVELRVSGDDLGKLEFIGNYLVSELEKISGVADIELSFEAGKKEIQIIPDKAKMGLYGLQVTDISNTIAIASYGRKISNFRGTGLDEYDLIVRVNDEQIGELRDLKELKIKTRQGLFIPLKEIADFEIKSGIAKIEHRNRKRFINVTANVTNYEEDGVKKIRTPDEVTAILKGTRMNDFQGVLSNFAEKFPGYQLKYGGSQEEKEKTYGSLKIAMIIALLLVFTILATQFHSVVQPLIVMMTIPFSLIGVILGLAITNLPFSLNTAIAVVALVGVVVNDSLVLVDFVNRERDKGIDRWHSLINAGAIRIRPILLTTVTTISGFMPIIFSNSSATQDWKPMAVSLAFGLAFATTLTLFILPVIYSFVDSLFGRLGLTRFKTHLSFKDAMAKNCEYDDC